MFKVTAPEVPPPVRLVPAVTPVISPTGTPATAVSTYSLFAASVLADTVSTPCILPVPPNVMSPPLTVMSEVVVKDPVTVTPELVVVSFVLPLCRKVKPLFSIHCIIQSLF